MKSLLDRSFTTLMKNIESYKGKKYKNQIIMIIIIQLNKIMVEDHNNNNMIRLYSPNYTDINRSVHIHSQNINVDDDNFVQLFNMFDKNPLIYTMMQYRDNLDKFYEEEFVDVDKLMKYYKQDPTNFSAYYSAVKRIENWFLECKFNPKYGYCQRRLQNEFDESFSNLS